MSRNREKQQGTTSTGRIRNMRAEESIQSFCTRQESSSCIPSMVNEERKKSLTMTVSKRAVGLSTRGAMESSSSLSHSLWGKQRRPVAEKGKKQMNINQAGCRRLICWSGLQGLILFNT